ncbi:MAG: T9SS type A sorting domain-containing protein [Cyclobacteriaceae bacterium]|nr:T9SS type A sorting domain-containing protein [Cyclobacteriaceae bacterium]
MKAFKTSVLLSIFLISGVMAFGQVGIAALATEGLNPGKGISIYPNPAVEYLDINLDQLNANTVKITLRNIIGNEVSVESEVIDDHKIRVRVKDYATGYYLLSLHDEETKFKGTYKFLKR